MYITPFDVKPDRFVRGLGRFVWALTFQGWYIALGFAGTASGPPSVPTCTDATGPVALLPPKKGTAPTQAMFFTKDDLKGETSRPLITTLPSPPPTSNRLGTGEISTLQALTDKRLFQFKYEQGQDASVFLVLSPFATG